jgi:excisionase family DNA binding protein
MYVMQETEFAKSAEGYVTKTIAAKHLGVCPRTLELWHRRGLPHYRLGARRTRYKLSELDAWMKHRNHVGGVY